MKSRMPLRPTTIRFAPDAMALVQEAAEEMGLSVAQFVREAAIIRAIVSIGHERANPVLEALKSVREDPEVQRLARRDD